MKTGDNDYFYYYCTVITIFVLWTAVPIKNGIAFQHFYMELGDKLLVSDCLGLYLSFIPWIFDLGHVA